MFGEMLRDLKVRLSTSSYTLSNKSVSVIDGKNSASCMLQQRTEGLVLQGIPDDWDDDLLHLCKDLW